jgi:hypothetical protein
LGPTDGSRRRVPLPNRSRAVPSAMSAYTLTAHVLHIVRSPARRAPRVACPERAQARQPAPESYLPGVGTFLALTASCFERTRACFSYKCRVGERPLSPARAS